MQSSVEVPVAFSVRDDHEFFPIQHLLGRMNPQLLAVQVATGRHVRGGCTVFWGLVYAEGQTLTRADVEEALAQAGFDFAHHGVIQWGETAPVAAGSHNGPLATAGRH
jgi:hypothetical protein